MTLLAAKELRHTDKAILLQIKGDWRYPDIDLWFPRSQAKQVGYVPSSEWKVYEVVTWLVRAKDIGNYEVRQTTDVYYIL